MKATLEELLRMTVKSPAPVTGGEVDVSPDFRIAVQEVTGESVRVIIHASGHSSDTLDFHVVGNELRPL